MATEDDRALARMEVELKHIIEAQRKADEAASVHLAAIEKRIEDMGSRIVKIENQLTGTKAFASGVRFAVYIVWAAIGSAATAALSSIWGK